MERIESRRVEVMMSVICFILAGICLILCILQFAEKGICFNNAYIFASEEERKRMNKKPHYRQSAIGFAFIGCALILIGLYAIFQSYFAIGLAVLSLIYAIISSIKEYK